MPRQRLGAERGPWPDSAAFTICRGRKEDMFGLSVQQSNFVLAARLELLLRLGKQRFTATGPLELFDGSAAASPFSSSLVGVRGSLLIPRSPPSTERWVAAGARNNNHKAKSLCTHLLGRS